MGRYFISCLAARPRPIWEPVEIAVGSGLRAFGFQAVEMCLTGLSCTSAASGESFSRMGTKMTGWPKIPVYRSSDLIVPGVLRVVPGVPEGVCGPISRLFFALVLGEGFVSPNTSITMCCWQSWEHFFGLVTAGNSARAKNRNDLCLTFSR